MRLKETLAAAAGQLNGLMAQSKSHHNPEKIVNPVMPALLRRVAAEGAVLLENRVLPLEKGTRVSLFGRGQQDYFYTGYGSGGDVNAPYTVSPLEGLRGCEDLLVNEDLAAVYGDWIRDNAEKESGWGAWPRFHPEMPVTAPLVERAAENSDQAVIVLGRASGEDRENVLEPGSYYLTDGEKQMLAAVTARFPDAVLLLNIGAMIDLNFLKDYSFGAVMILWQGGMESGNAAADLLCGRAVPCGHLTDTAAKDYRSYPSADCFGNPNANEYREDIYVGYRWFETFHPEDVLYPLGYGLSYTDFSVTIRHTAPLEFRAEVVNTGKFPGKEAVMLFVQKPSGPLGNPARELSAFGKTGLLAPGQRQELTLKVTEYQLSSYDDSGITGHKSCYVLQGGAYRFYCGRNVRDAAFVGDYVVPALRVFRQMTEACAPEKAFPVWANQAGEPVRRMAPARTANRKQRILEDLPEDIPMTGDRGILLKDVKEGRTSMDAFLAQLDLGELEAISRGAYTMGNPLGARGNAGVFGGVTESLRKKGIPPITTTDGPSGIRLYDSCSLLPMGTLLACTFDTGLVEELYRAVGEEMKKRGSDVLLAPGMNIHRNPLCGRNFEYFSEDPYLTGRMAAAVVKGIQSQGVSACVKHFACNNQEVNRTNNDSIVSERALREIYLKGFEICLKLAKPITLMTSYNKINGIWSHYNFELVQTIARKEWGYGGLVMTDWWMRYAPSPEFPELTGNGYRVRARVNLLMPGSRRLTDIWHRPDGTLLATFGKPGGITLGEMQETARQVLNCVMKLKL
ncbi:MAG: glycoside hydrolase family 3 C-terminal domain-containing protein [Clostridiales bacterium]|nr:glycoside hydrolase family 3 C-terminal domain-containing protein [Clostridiales bacterium]